MQPLAATRQVTPETIADTFFTEGTIAEKMQSAVQLSQIEVFDASPTAILWEINTPNTQIIRGRSVDLNHAIRDIHAQLFLLSTVMAQDTEISIGSSHLPTPHTAIYN